MKLYQNLSTGSDIIDIQLVSGTSDIISGISRDFEILLVISGAVNVISDDAQHDLTANHILAVNPGCNRNYRAASEDTLAAVFTVSKIKLWRLAPGISLYFYIDTQKEPLKSYANLHHLLKRALFYHMHDDLLSNLSKLSCFYDILHELVGSHSSWHVASDNSDKSKRDLRKLEVLNYIHGNYYKQISLDEIAVHLNLSSSYLSKFIKQCFGTGFSQLVNETRLQYAVDDLINTDMSISQIALENGFASFSSFNRVFKNEFNLTPTEYRKANKKRAAKKAAALIKEKRGILKKYLDGNDYPVIYDADFRDAVKYKKFWSKVISLGPAHNLLDSGIQEHVLHLKQELDFEYLHISSLFNEKLLIDYRSTEGFNYARINRLLDFLVQNKIVPFIDLGFQPWGIIGNSHTELIYEGYDLQDYSVGQYENLVKDFIKQCIIRYGEDAISKWRFDLFYNEAQPIYDIEHPNQSFISFFETAFRVIKKLVPSSKVGGCGFYTYEIDNFEHFLNVCRDRGLQPDFFSVQIYPYNLIRNETLKDDKYTQPLSGRYFSTSSDEEYISKKVDQLKSALINTGYSPDLLIVIGWTMSLSCRNYLNDSGYRGAFLVKNMISCLDKVEIMSHEGITDLVYEHFSPTLQLFGGYGLLTKDGLKKPAYYAFDFMNRLGNLLIDKGPNYIVTRDTHGRIFIVCHNCGRLTSEYYSRYDDNVSYNIANSLTISAPLSFLLKVKNVPAGQFLVKKLIVSEDNGSVLGEWIKLGYIEDLGREDIDYLASISVPRQQSEAINTQDNAITVRIDMTTNEIQFIQILPIKE